MATIKSYTDIEQSKKLAEILPLESADMHYNDWNYDFYDGYERTGIYVVDLGTPQTLLGVLDIPCWSLAALLSVLPRIEGLKPVLDLEINYVQYPSDIDLGATADNPIDACVAMIEKLHELKML